MAQTKKDKIDKACDDATNKIMETIYGLRLAKRQSKRGYALWGFIWDNIYHAVNCDAKKIFSEPKK